MYGASRLGMARVAPGDYSINKYEYELSDHLGNVRATFSDDEGNTGKAKTVNYTDYYPFGWEVPNRIQADNSYRFAYQGQFAEKDEETGFTQFEARLFDNRIGRWMAIDPAYQFWSPYLGMGNNPVCFNDPKGESIGTWIRAQWHAFRYGGEVVKTPNGHKVDRFYTDYAVLEGQVTLTLLHEETYLNHWEGPLCRALNKTNTLIPYGNTYIYARDAPMKNAGFGADIVMQ